jgi:HEAT repeat protein
MIRFSCPQCDTNLRAPESKARTKVACPKCGKAVLVPSVADEDDRETEPSPAPRKTSKRPKRPQPAETSRPNTVLIVSIAGGVVAACLVIGGVFFYTLKSGPSIPSERLAPKPTYSGSPPSADQQPQQPQVARAEPKPQAQTQSPANPDAEPPPVLFANQAAGPEIRKHVVKSVVWIFNNTRENRIGAGTGTLVDRANRWILTSYHVIAGSRDMIVLFPIYDKDGTPIDDRATYLRKIAESEQELIHGRIIAQDPGRDLALIQVPEVPADAQALALARAPVEAGQAVHSVGIPGVSGGMWVYTAGRVRVNHPFKWGTAGHRGEQPMIFEAQVVETDSPVNPGDSGGPLVNDRAELVGVTHGGHLEARALSLFIDVRDVTRFLEGYSQRNSLVWNREKRSLGGTVDPKSVSELVRYLDHSSAKTRGQAAERLAELGPQAKSAVPFLLKIAENDQDAFTRRLALTALTKIGPPEAGDLESVQTALGDSSVEVRKYAAEILGKMGADGRPAASKLASALKDRDTRVRQVAAHSLGLLGPEARDVSFPALSDALRDTDHDVRVAAAEALASGNITGPGDVRFLGELLKHIDPEVRGHAARAIGRLGGAAKASVPTLMELTKNSDPASRRGAVDALSQLGPDAKDAVPVLSDALADSDKDVRKNAAIALGRIGADAKPAAYSLAKAATDSEPEVRKNALAALGKVGPDKNAAPALAEVLTDKDRNVRLEAITLLSALGVDAKPAIPNLIRLLESETDHEVGLKAAHALGKAGKGAVKDLKNALTNNSAGVRLGAAMALADIGPAAKEATKALQYCARFDNNPRVQQAALNALQRITAKP